jgi:adenine-specific DNA methylase
MIPGNCKRLAEVDFPLTAVNAACVEENNRKTRINSGHFSLLHSWWARRPLSACRSLLLTLLLPDPCDPHCPDEFKTEARKILLDFGKSNKADIAGNEGLQKALFQFIAEIAPWDSVQITGFLSTAQALIRAAYGKDGDMPHILDPFSGGGSIPLEARRLGCEVTAADLNPVAWLLLKIALEWCGRKGPELAVLFGEWSDWVLKETEKRLAEYYPADDRERKPLAYLWARTAKCEASGCGVTIPLIRGICLSKSNGRKKALRIKYREGKSEPVFEIFVPQNDNEIESGTVAGMNASCPKCHTVTRRERVQAQLRDRQGGTADAILFAVVRSNPGGTGKDYYAPTREDIAAFNKAAEKAKSVRIEMPSAPPGGDTGFRPRAYGITNWADVFAPRQKLSRWIIHEVIEDALKSAEKKKTDKDILSALAACLYAAFSDNSQYHTSLCVWLSEGVKSIYIQGSGIPFRADFVESYPLSPNCDGLQYSVRSIQSALNKLTSNTFKPTVPFLANVLDSILPDESMDVVFTDPPYADQIPYAHLSDFFYGLLRLGLKERLPQSFTSPETEKARELTENRAVNADGVHNRRWYENGMRNAFIRMKQTIQKDGIAAFVFAHKETDRWESLVSALIQAGWCVTGSWPIATERRQRMRGQGYAALETSVHLICRPRHKNAPVGDWGVVLSELPKRVGDWMERLQGEGIRGADLVFACIGPALEVFSCYRKVETADGREVPLAEYLVKVWEIVGRSALEQVLGTAEAKARNGAAGALEEDARLTALFLWTLQASLSNKNNSSSGIGANGRYDDDDNGGERTKKKKGYTLTFDVARRFAQPLGVVLSKWEHRIIEIEKGEVRLLPVTERTKQLFGDEGAAAVSRQLERNPEQILQQSLFPEIDTFSTLHNRGRKKRGIISPDSSIEPEFRDDHQVTTLDRVHAAMLLQAGGQTNGLRTLIKTEQKRGPDFLRLSNALSALYPSGSEEKRLLDAMLLAIPRKS